MAKREELTRDLFAHFGVDLRPPPGQVTGALRPLRPARPCESCDWLRIEPRVGACPVCGAPPIPIEG